MIKYLKALFELRVIAVFLILRLVDLLFNILGLIIYVFAFIVSLYGFYDYFTMLENYSDQYSYIYLYKLFFTGLGMTKNQYITFTIISYILVFVTMKFFKSRLMLATVNYSFTILYVLYLSDWGPLNEVSLDKHGFDYYIQIIMIITTRLPLFIMSFAVPFMLPNWFYKK